MEIARAADFAGLLAWRQWLTMSLGQRAGGLPAALSLQWFTNNNVRLTVARRRRRFTVFPSTKSAVVVEGRRPLWVANVGDSKTAGLG